jgi:hypothetical protein
VLVHVRVLAVECLACMCVLWCLQARRCIAPDSGRFLGGWLLGMASIPSCRHSARTPCHQDAKKKQQQQPSPWPASMEGGVELGCSSSYGAMRQQHQPLVEALLHPPR